MDYTAPFTDSEAQDDCKISQTGTKVSRLNIKAAILVTQYCLKWGTWYMVSYCPVG